MDCSMSGSFVLHYLLEFVKIHVPWVSDTIKPSHPLSPPVPPAFNLSQDQGLFCWVSSSRQVAKGLELQHQSFQWMFRVDFLLEWLVWSSCCLRDSQEFYLAPQFKINALAFSVFYGPALTSIYDYWKNIALTIWNFVNKVMSLLFNMLSSFVIAFLPRRKHLLISWLQSPSAVTLEPKK